jgi:hypothetical protein
MNTLEGLFTISNNLLLQNSSISNLQYGLLCHISSYAWTEYSLIYVSKKRFIEHTKKYYFLQFGK